MTEDKRDETRTESDFAALWSSDGVTRSMSPTATGMPADLPFLFGPGQAFGGYRIIRPLGKGGMGQVYEAEETESGRRVALKLLSRGLGDDEERERFLREGRLAASLSHPNCVYVFGTSEIQGFPVIAMELVPEGTLKDRVVPDAPMTSAQAVDAILQVLDGLEAAASIGILHRDIKPSNCFVHRDGRVLVGDFGLSVAARGDEKSAGTILGTPGFASPEQLRGEGLDVRSDIYSVGATLFYLLVGRAPFVDRDTTSLLKRVATEPPPLLTTVRPDLSRGLAAIVAKCLARTPAERYVSYPALRAALEPFGSALLAPAPIVRRIVGGLIDGWFISLTLFPANLILQLRPVFAHRADGYILGAISVTVAALYYGYFEGRWGAGAGKALLGLRVVDAHHVSPGFRRAVWRALVFDLPTQVLKPLAATLVLLANPDMSAGFVSSIAGVLWLTVLFSRARPKNGWTALHDRATATRVVRRRARAEARDHTSRVIGDLAVPIEGDERIGPFVVPSSTPIAVSAPTRIVGFDDRLHRRVWIELLPEGTPPLPAQRRDLGRPARLRWLAGRRNGKDCWDAYEAVEGTPLSALAGSPQPWSRVRHWLSDLVREVAIASEEGPLPHLIPGRVWVGTDGHARILEWPAPDQEHEEVVAEGPSDLAAAQKFLCAVAAAALTGTTVDEAIAKAPETPLPLRARTFLLGLRDAKFASAAALLEGLKDVAETPAAISRSRRATQLAACGMFPVIVTAIALGSILVVGKMKGTDQTLFRLEALLDDLEKSEKSLAKKADPAVQQKHDDVEVYLAEHMAAVIRNPATWESKNPRVGSRGGKERARVALERHPTRTADEIRRAEATVAPILESQAEGLEKLASARVLTGIVVATLGGTFIAVAFFAGVGALVTGSGFTFRPFGAALVNRRGQRISRVRALWRAGVTWSPMIALAFVLKNGPDVTQASTTVVMIDLALVAVIVAGAVWASQHPPRGLQDRLAGTWVVPR
jgi:hypothetical protein